MTTKIGTALSPNASKVLLLGSGELGKEIAISLQRYGVEVIAADRYQNAPAMQIAQRSFVLDMTDAAKMHELVAAVQPNFIVPEIEAIATDALAQIEAQGSNVVPNARAVQLTMNREGIRTLVAETLGLATSKYAFAATFAQLQQAVVGGIGYPCFVKPTMSSSGKGQSRVVDAGQLQAAWDYALAGGRAATGKVIVEAAVDFAYEITLLVVRAVGKNGEVQTHFCQPIGHRQENGDYRESWQPQQMNKAALATAQDMAKQVTDNIGGRGLFGVEFFVRGDTVWFSEISPRPHDTGMVTMASQRQSQFDLHARAILGLPVCSELASPAASAVILGTADSADIFYCGLDTALADPAVDIRIFAKPRSHIGRRMGVALATAPTTSTARQKASDAASCIAVTVGD